MSPSGPQFSPQSSVGSLDLLHLIGLQSALRNPHSAIRTPQSARRNPQSALHSLQSSSFELPTSWSTVASANVNSFHNTSTSPSGDIEGEGNIKASGFRPLPSVSALALTLAIYHLFSIQYIRTILTNNSANNIFYFSYIHRFVYYCDSS